MILNFFARNIECSSCSFEVNPKDLISDNLLFQKLLSIKTPRSISGISKLCSLKYDTKKDSA